MPDDLEASAGADAFCTSREPTMADILLADSVQSKSGSASQLTVRPTAASSARAGADFEMHL
jgi:hypothetical protein